MWALAGRKDLAAFRGTKPPLSPPSAHPSLGAAVPLTSLPGDSSPLGGEAFGGPPTLVARVWQVGCLGRGWAAEHSRKHPDRSVACGRRAPAASRAQGTAESAGPSPGSPGEQLPASQPENQLRKTSRSHSSRSTVGARAASHPQREAVRGIHTTRGSHGQEGAVVTAAPRLTPRWR